MSKKKPLCAGVRADLFWSKAVIGSADVCWPWGGYLHPKGYGQFGGRWAHRVAYELKVGTIHAGLVIDHLCRNRRCINPFHLEPVTVRENTLRGNGKTAEQARQSHCKNGHPLSGDNLSQSRGGRRERRCKQCHRERMRRVYREANHHGA